MDIAKGIGILLMVCGHAFVLGKHFYTLFHMPLFFIISGYFIKDYNFANLTNVVAFVKKGFYNSGFLFSFAMLFLSH